MERNSMVFYRSFYEAMEELNPEVKANVFDAIMQFSLNGKELDLSGISKTVFILIKPQLSANIKRYENGKQPKRPRARAKQDTTKKEGNKNENENEDVNAYWEVHFQDDENVSTIKTKKEKFVAPLLEEVKEFFSTNGFKSEVGKTAFDYYNEAGWKDSRGKAIQNWKQKMRGVWFKEENKIVASASKQVYSQPAKYRPA